ncbi:double zinc ribbon domain-containing protein [Paeniroseomonas aquatica]|uniref:double zinc ribbon domain-containing protein n=1 Tax=Paeniroseomonas aquatica TaxID=373043 RepID=UPI0036165F04
MTAAARILPKLGPWMARLGTGLLDAVLPPHCLTCEAEVDHQGALCAACFRTLSFVTAPLCACCGVPFPHAGAGRPSPSGRSARPATPPRRPSPRPGRRCATTPARSG